MKSLVRLLLHLWRVPSTGVEDRRELFGTPADVETMLREGRY